MWILKAKLQLAANKLILWATMLAILGSVPTGTLAQSSVRSPNTTTPPTSRQPARHTPQRTFRPIAQQNTPFSPPSPTIKTVGTNLQGFGIPFNIDADDGSFIEVQLYLSRDGGQNWQFYARQTTDQKDIPFKADQDGEYWFALKTLNRDRKLIPEGDTQAELKIIIDTQKPTLDVVVETDAAGRVVCRWRAEDPNLQPKSLKILYQPITDAGPTDWSEVPVQLNGTARAGLYADQIAWWPDTTQSRVNVAVQIADIAGNVSRLERYAVLSQTAWRHRSQSIARITDSVNRQPSTGTDPPTQTTRKTPLGFPPLPNTTAVTHPALDTHRSSKHPLNVVCENGVCKIPRNTQLASSRLQTPQNLTTGLVGSDIEYVDPPVPPGLEDSPVINAQSGTAQPSSILWQSQPQRTLPRRETSFNSTLRPNPNLAPTPRSTSRQTYPSPTTIPSNPPTTQIVGDQVISQSSTLSPNNQYRGPNSTAGTNFPKPTLLPRIPSPSNDDSLQSNAVENQPKNNSSPDTSTGLAPITQNTRPSQHPAGDLNTSPATKQNSRFVPSSFSRIPTSSSTVSTAKPNRQTRAPLQIIGSKRFRLNYGIDSIDPSGVARVDLWMTQDDGKTWKSWGSDPDHQSPFPVEVQQEGRYGFRIVVHSKDGLTGQGPSSGDDADMWIVIDTQAPLAQITSVPYGRGDEAGRLVINYSVADPLLTLRPITLGYSASPQGPWIVIEQGLRNDGRYVWKVGTDVPDRVYLRIEAVDRAGNVGNHVLSQVIDVSGLVPRGTIHGVSPVGRN